MLVPALMGSTTKPAPLPAALPPMDKGESQNLTAGARAACLERRVELVGWSRSVGNRAQKVY